MGLTGRRAWLYGVSAYFVAMSRASARGPCAARSPFRDSSPVVADPQCDAWLVTSQPMVTTWSYGMATLRESVRGDFDFSARLQRLSPDSELSVEVRMPSGILLLQPGRWGLYEGEVRWSQGRWNALPGHRNTRAFDLQIAQRGESISITLDDEDLGEHRWSQYRKKGDLAIGFKADTGLRGRLRVSHLRFTNRSADSPTQPAL